MATRLPNTLLNNGMFGDNQPYMIDLANGGPMGWAPDFGRWVSAKPYVRKQLFARVMISPRGFNDLPNPAGWHAFLRAYFEKWVKSINGFDSKRTIDSVDTPFGADGAQFSTPSKSSRQQPEMTTDHTERDGRPMTKFFEGWTDYLIQDPNTGFPGVRTLGVSPTDYLPDYYSATILFFEPNPLFNDVEKAWLGANIYPSETPSTEAKREITEAGDLLESSIPWKGIYLTGEGPRQLAKQFLDALTVAKADPNLRPAFESQIDGALIKANNGIFEEIAAAASSAVQR